MWDELCENNFRKLKQKAEADILLLPNISKPFIILYDTSDKAIGFNLAEEENKQLRLAFYGDITSFDS